MVVRYAQGAGGRQGGREATPGWLSSKMVRDTALDSVTLRKTAPS